MCTEPSVLNLHYKSKTILGHLPVMCYWQTVYSSVDRSFSICGSLSYVCSVPSTQCLLSKNFGTVLHRLGLGRVIILLIYGLL